MLRAGILMHESTDRERKTELYKYEVLLLCITAVQQAAYHTVVVEEGCAGHEDVQETGIISAPDRTLSRGVAVKVAIKRS